MAQESSSSNSGASHCRYHVFLSFRGEDTRKTFTDHLYTAFKDQGFRTFRDDDELERGEDINPGIKRAIQQSRSSVIVFSSDYASSSWCLNELLMILERKRTSDHVVLPVFYNVDPSQVRKQTGCFGKAFARHQETHPSEKVKEWKDALTKVADLGGMVLRNQDDGYESKFIKTIVKEIGDKLSRTVPLSVGSNLIGIHARANKINRWIQDEPDGVGIHVIFGMSGIGKTTVAKHVYNSNFRSFEGSSFIENIRQTSEQINGIVKLQKQLLHDILNGREVKIRNASEGKIAIEDAISCKRILLVLDDVDHMDQFDALLTMKDRFHKGSKIIITTRRAWVLKAEGITKVHYVRALKESEALTLFSLHAFRQEHPNEGYMEQTEKFVRHCAGLPLALRVLGSSLFRENIAVWESALRKLESIPNSEIVHKLRMSYDALDKHDQEVFLHIACFFIGNEKDNIVDVLDGCEFYTTIGIINLIDRCLLAIGANNKLVMHDMVRDMGRGIVRLSAEEPRKRSRLWHHKESFKVLKEKNGTKKIEGLELVMQRNLGVTTPSKNELILESNAFARMHKLRVLRLSHVQLTGSCAEIPTGLRMLCWIAFPLDSIPNEFHLENLVALEMHYSSLRQILNGTKCFPSLKILDLSHSHGLIATVDFSLCPNLKKLTLMDCEGLIDVHESIGNLEFLVYLNMKDCISLGRLPKTFGMLKLLDTLIISGCSNLKNSSIEMVRSMESLKVLEMDRIPVNQLFTLCGEVKSGTYLPCSLLSLSLSRCNLTDEAFPVDFASLPLLSSLNLSENPISALPNCVKGLTTLQSLSFENCLSLKSLLELPKVGFYSTLSGCESLERITYRSSSCAGANMSGRNYCLVDWEYEYKLEPIRSVDGEILNILGLSKLDIDLMPNVRMCKPYQGYDIVHQGGVQGLHDYESMRTRYFRGNARKITMFSTFLPGNEVPGQFSHRTKGSSSISLTVPLPSVQDIRIRGFNMFIVYAISNNEDKRYSSSVDQGSITIDLINKSNDDNWQYAPVFHGVPGKGEDMIWLTHWNMDNQVKGGHQIAVSLSVTHASFRYHVKEWGIQVVQEKQEEIMCTDQNTTAGDLLTSDESLGEPYLLSHEPNSTEDKEKGDDEEVAPGDPVPASAIRASSSSNNTNDHGLRKWKVLIVAAIVLVASISVANRFEDSNIDTIVAKTVTNADNEEEQGDEVDKSAVVTNGSNNRARDPRKWKVPFTATIVMIILYLSVRWLFFFSARDDILVPT